jgi:transcriptional regulator with XRE-family HTH domain
MDTATEAPNSTEKTQGQKLRALRRQRNKTPQEMSVLLGISKSGYEKKEESEGNFESKTIIQLSEILDVGEDYFWLNLSPTMYDNFEECKLLFYSFIKLKKEKRDWLMEWFHGAELAEKLGAKDLDREAFNNGIISKKRRERLEARKIAANSTSLEKNFSDKMQ